MTNQNYQERKINENVTLLNNYLNKIYGLHFHLENCEFGEEEYIDKEIEQKYYEFNSTLKDTYLLVFSYIESQGNTELLKIYQATLSEILTENFNAIETQYVDEIEETFYVSKSFNKLNQFLLPYQAFALDKEITISAGIIYLENILTNTAIILKELKETPKSETQVYNAVKFVLKSTFPDSVLLSEPFYKTAKCYKPDILIPSIHTAVEYKYAEDEQRLIKTIEEILIDVVGYSNHPIYKTFYAVFYVKPGICSEKRFKIMWDEKKFPNNWKPILSIGE
jgi:hypothetical protein